MTKENELACLMEEYKLIRSEIVSRNDNAQQIVSYTFALAAALLPAIKLLIDNSQFTAIAVIPFIFFMINYMILQHDKIISSGIAYINSYLAPRIEEILMTEEELSGPIWAWDVYQYEMFYKEWKSRLIYSGWELTRYVFPTILGVSVLIAYFLIQSNLKFAINWYDWVILSGNIFVILWFLLVGYLTVQGMPVPSVRARSKDKRATQKATKKRR